MARDPIPLEVRLWRRVVEAGPDDLSPNGWRGCWLWTGYCNPKGYGTIGEHSRRILLVHRLAYALVVGVIPIGLELDHLCRRRCCCNPAHLEAVTHLENVRRGALARC